MEAACSLDPSAKDWAVDDTWPEADATSSAPSVRPSITRFNDFVIDRLMKKAKNIASRMVAIPIPTAIFERLNARFLVSVDFSVSRLFANL
jgi:hypothetical protein